MNERRWVKRYEDPATCRAARDHLRWLANLRSGVRLPVIYSAGPRQLVFEHLGDQNPGPEHLRLLAAVLGQLHAAAYTKELHCAQLDQPFQNGELVIVDFVSPRHHVLRQLDLDLVGLPAAFYKDANLRNFILLDGQVAIVDFDDLTLAPFGYDLAKLIVSMTMTHGALAADDIVSALNVYNRRTAGLGPETSCSLDRLLTFAEMHHLLTSRYLGRHGYRYTWSDARPISARP